jgi:hypothetical protein
MNRAPSALSPSKWAGIAQFSNADMGLSTGGWDGTYILYICPAT